MSFIQDSSIQNKECVWILSDYSVLMPILAFDTTTYLFINFVVLRDKDKPEMRGKSKIMINLTMLTMIIQLGLAIANFLHQKEYGRFDAPLYT